MENEHLSNKDQFRLMPEVPLPHFHNVGEDDLESIDSGEDSDSDTDNDLHGAEEGLRKRRGSVALARAAVGQ